MAGVLVGKDAFLVRELAFAMREPGAAGLWWGSILGRYFAIPSRSGKRLSIRVVRAVEKSTLLGYTRQQGKISVTLTYNQAC
jgi:hypothetical protein